MKKIRKSAAVIALGITAIASPMMTSSAPAQAADLGGTATVVTMPGNLQLGSYNLDVVALKRHLGTISDSPSAKALLAQANADLTIATNRDRALRFDSATQAEVLAFQRFFGRPQTGRFDQGDWRSLLTIVDLRETTFDATKGNGPSIWPVATTNGSKSLLVVCPPKTAPNQQVVAFITDYSQRSRLVNFLGVNEFDGMANCDANNLAPLNLPWSANRIPGDHSYGIVVRTITLAPDGRTPTATLDTHFTFHTIRW